MTRYFPQTHLFMYFGLLKVLLSETFRNALVTKQLNLPGIGTLTGLCMECEASLKFALLRASFTPKIMLLSLCFLQIRPKQLEAQCNHFCHYYSLDPIVFKVYFMLLFDPVQIKHFPFAVNCPENYLLALIIVCSQQIIIEPAILKLCWL